MMTYVVWNPYIVDDNNRILKFSITYGALGPGLGGQKKFFQMILDDIGILAKVVSWKLYSYRTHYYTEYFESHNWKNRWSIAWFVTLELDREISSFEQDDHFSWLATAATRNKRIQEPLKVEAIPCLVVADFDTSEAFDSIKHAIFHDTKCKKFQQKYQVTKPTFQEQRILRRLFQLQICLGGFDAQYYVNGADYAMYVLELCQRVGGTTHYTKRSL